MDRRLAPGDAGCGSGSAAAGAGLPATSVPSTTASRKAAYCARHRVPVAFARHVIARSLAQRLRHVRPRDQQVQVFEDQVLFARAHRHFQAHVVGELAERADVGNQHRLAQSQRAQQRAGTLAHRGIAQVQHDVAGAPDSPTKSSMGVKPSTRTLRRKLQASGSAAPPENRDAARPPGSSWRSAPGAPAGERRAAIRRCACTA